MKNNKEKVIGVLLILAAFLLFFYLNNRSLRLREKFNTPQTYTNQESGYTVTYPGTWKLDVTKEDQVYPGDWGKHLFMVWNGFNYISFYRPDEDKVNQLLKDSKSDKQETREINGQRFTVFFNNFQAEQGLKSGTTLVSEDKKLLITVSLLNVDTNLREIKFVDDTVYKIIGSLVK